MTPVCIQSYLSTRPIPQRRVGRMMLVVCIVLCAQLSYAGAGVDFHLDYGRAKNAIRTHAPMDRAVMSWNVETPGKSSIDAYLRARTPTNTWTTWYHLGTWGSGIASKSHAAQTDAAGAVDIDTLFLTTPTTRWQYRLVLHPDPAGPRPSVHAVAIAFKNSQTYRKQLTSTLQIAPLAVPTFSQFEAGRRSGDPDLGQRICSPTSVAMVLHYHGLPTTPIAISQHVRDTGGTIPYGNWSFNTAALYQASRRTSYVRWYENFDEVLAHVQRGQPTVVSIGFQAGELAGAPRPTPGHLVVVRGADTKYIYVNDPAAPSATTVARRYRKDEFLRAWKGVAYVSERNY